MNKAALRLMNRDLSDAQRLVLAAEQLRRWRTAVMLAAHSLEIAIENKNDRAGVMQIVLNELSVILKDAPVVNPQTKGRVTPELFGAKR